MLKTKYQTDKTELENKIPDVSNLVTKTKFTELENKILECLLETSKYKYCPKFRHLQNKSIIYRPSIYNLQTRPSTFQHQEKLFERVNLRYLKTLETKKLNIKNPQIKHYPCSKYVMIHRPDLQI